MGKNRHQAGWYLGLDGTFHVCALGDTNRDNHSGAASLPDALKRFLDVRKIVLENDALLLLGPVDPKTAMEPRDEDQPLLTSA